MFALPDHVIFAAISQFGCVAIVARECGMVTALCTVDITMNFAPQTEDTFASIEFCEKIANRRTEPIITVISRRWIEKWQPKIGILSLHTAFEGIARE